ncbi:MAG: hypothetical protein ACYDCI_15480, partial [Candidatus Limnocylindrales bacterium]
ALALLEPAYATLAPELPDDPEMVSFTALLARGYQLHEEPQRAIEWADRALAAAERLYLVPVIAESITTKGSSMAIIGRVWEGLGLVRAGRQLADANGLTATSLRAAVSLTGSLTVYDPRSSYDVGREGYELARRLGLRHLAVILAANGGEAGLSIGELDGSIAALEEAGSIELEAVDRMTVLGVMTELLAVRGVDVRGRLEELATLGDEGDPVFGATTWLARLWAALADGRMADAHHAGLMVAEVSTLNRPYGLLWAVYATIRDGDAVAARRTLDDLAALAVRGPSLDAERLALEAGVLSLEGRWPEATSRFQEAARRLRDLRVDLDLAVMLILAVSVAPPGDPFAASAATEARAILNRIDAPPFIVQLDRLLAGHGARSGARGAAVSSAAQDPTTVAEPG